MANPTTGVRSHMSVIAAPRRPPGAPPPAPPASSGVDALLAIGGALPAKPPAGAEL